MAKKTTKKASAPREQQQAKDYVVLLYPSNGSPRAVEVPHVTPEIAALIPVERFDTKAAAEAALEKFLTEFPEYRRWRDGHLTPG